MKFLIKLFVLILIFLSICLAQKPYIKNYNKGMDFFNKGEYDKAIQWFEKSIKAKNDWDTVYVSLGLCYFNKEDYSAALQNFDKAISLNKNNSSAYYNSAKAYSKIGKDNDALKSYKAAYDIDTLNLDALAQVGLLSYKLKDYNQSLWAYKKLAKVKTADGPIFYNLGNAYFNLEDYDNAIVAYNTAIKKNKKNADYYYAIGMAYLKNANYPKAKANFLIAYRLNPRKYYNLFDIIDYSGIQFEFLRTNFFGDELISKTSNGIRIGINLQTVEIKTNLLNKITGLPIWSKNINPLSYGAIVSYFYNPLSLYFSFNSLTYDLNDAKIYFPLPPYNPNGSFPKTLKINNYEIFINYSPFVFWGKFYNDYSVGYNATTIDYNNDKYQYRSLVLSTGINFKYNKIWAGVKYNYYTNKDLNTKLQFNVGLWIW